MGPPRSYQTEAIVIKQSRLGEFDKIITFYTPEFGKLKAVAKGACRPKSKLGGNVEPLTYSLVLLAKGRNLDIVTQSQTIDGFMALKSDLWRASCGLYILELIDSFTMENSENRPLFNLLLDALRQLCQVDSRGIVLRYFELHLLHYLGYRPQLHRCVMCDSPLKPEVNFFSSSQGGVLCHHCNSRETRHYEPFAPYHSDSFALCHSERSEESRSGQAPQPKNLAQDKLREEFHGAQDRIREAISLSSSLPLSLDALKVLRLWQDCDYATARRVKVKSELSSQLAQALQCYIVYLLQRKVRAMAWLEELKKLDNHGGEN